MVSILKQFAEAAVGAVNCVQTITVGDNATPYVLSWLGRPTTRLATDATYTQVQTALRALPGVGTDITVSGSAGGPYTVTFSGALGGQRQPLIKASQRAVVVTYSVEGNRATGYGTATDDVFAVGESLYRNAGTPTVPVLEALQAMRSHAYGNVAAAGATAIHAAVTDTGVDVVVTTAITNPDVPRNITATAGGTAGDVKAIAVTITGTNVDGEEITEELPAFTVNTTGLVTGSKAFKTVTSIAIPAHDGNGATTAIGTGSKLGIGELLTRNTVINAYLAGVKEGTAPTVVFDDDEIEKNTVTLNSSLNGTAVIVDYYR